MGHHNTTIAVQQHMNPDHVCTLDARDTNAQLTNRKPLQDTDFVSEF